MRKYFFVCILVLTFAGCVSVKKAFDNYEACKGDVQCVAEMEKARSASAVIAETASAPFFPNSVPSVIGWLVSNAVAFGVGVVKGKKKGV